MPVLLSLDILGALLSGCLPAATTVPTPVQVDLQIEEQAVYTALFDGIFGEPRMYVIMDQTSPGMEGVDGMDPVLDSILPQLSGLDDETAASFRMRNEVVISVRPDMDLGLPYVLLTRAEFAEIFAINSSGWDIFYTRYPNSPGLTTISQIGFNEEFTQALVYVGTMSYWLAGSGYYVLLGRSSGAWQIIAQVMAWIS